MRLRGQILWFMSRSDFFKAAVLSSVLIIFIFHWTSGSSYSAVSQETESSLLSSNPSSKFTSSEEFVLHTKNYGTCLTEQCHIEFKNKRGKIHEPVSSGKCSECHNAGLYPNKFGLERNQRNSCSNCHKNMEREIQSSKSVHGPKKTETVHPVMIRTIQTSRFCLGNLTISCAYPVINWPALTINLFCISQ